MLFDGLTSTYVAFESSKNYVMMIDGPANMIWSLSNSQKRSNQPSKFFYVAQKGNVVSLPMAENQQLAVKFVHFLLFLSNIFHDWNSFFPAKWMLLLPVNSLINTIVPCVFIGLKSEICLCQLKTFVSGCAWKCLYCRYVFDDDCNRPHRVVMCVILYGHSGTTHWLMKGN